MCIIRVTHHHNYTCISNDAIRDTRLSFKARGIHHLLLSYPNNWEAKVEHLVKQSDKDGRSAVLSGLDELEEFGYLTRQQLRDSKGQFAGWQVIVKECSDVEVIDSKETPFPENPIVERTDCGKPIPIISTEETNKYLVQEIPTLPPTPQELSNERENKVKQPSNNCTPSPNDRPTKEQIAEVSHKLRELRLNPDDWIGRICKWWANANDAIAYLKQGITQGWCKNPAALFTVALKEGRKPTLGTSITKLTDRGAWWKEAAAFWGREKRDKLFCALTELHGETLLFLTNGKTIGFEDVQSMSWEMIEAIAIE